MRARKTKTQIRQEQIAAAALELMARHGPKSLNLAALAHQIGVVPSAIYRHYPGKDAVLDAVLDLIASRLQENVNAVRQEESAAPGRLRRLLGLHVHLLQNNMAIPRVVLSEEVFNANTRRRQRVHRIIQDYLGKVAQLVREGQQDGTLRPDVPADTAAVMFLGLIHPAAILWLTSNGAFNVGLHTERAWSLFANMIVAQPAPLAGRLHFATVERRQAVNTSTRDNYENEHRPSPRNRRQSPRRSGVRWSAGRVPGAERTARRAAVALQSPPQPPREKGYGSPSPG